MVPSSLWALGLEAGPGKGRALGQHEGFCSLLQQCFT